MTYIQKAIEKSIERGYKNGHSVRSKLAGFWIYSKDGETYHFTQSEIFLDPLFWQCLGKAMGWGMIIKTSRHPDGIWDGDNIEWKESWHSFIDHLADQKDPELFFKQLLQ